MDFENLLKEISQELPSGPNLEYDPEFLALERAARGKPEQAFGDVLIPAEEPDWADVRQRALSLLDRTHDLRVASQLTLALLHSDGFPGFAQGLALIERLLVRYWGDVHPQLDSEDGNDPTARLNALAALAHPGTTVKYLGRVPLVSVPAVGRFSLRDVQISRGGLQPLPGDDPVDGKLIDSAFALADVRELQNVMRAVQDAIDSLKAIESFLVSAVGAEQVPDTDVLPETLRACRVVLEEQLRRRGEAPMASPAGGPAGGATAPVMLAGGVQSREDAARALDAVIDYFTRNEPSSPVPLLLHRAKRLISKSFLEIVRDLAPDGVKQAEGIRGIDSEG